eukprot:4902645-Amphidinium_carterae.1
MPRAWSHQPARTQAIAPEPKKRPHSDSSKDANQRGCNNLHGVTVARVDGELQASGPQDKVDLVDPIALHLLFLGDRRGAQEHLRNNRRALRKRYEEHLPPGGQGTPEQLLRFAEAKARKMPWDDDRTM